MQVSLQSKVCIGTCVAVSAYAAYSNPVRWMTCYVVGVLAQMYLRHSDFQAAREGHQPENGLTWDADEDQTIREKAVKSLVDLSIPGKVMTAINLLALGVISQRIQLPSGWNPLIEAFICRGPVFTFGTLSVGLFYLDKLQKDQKLEIRNLLAKTTI
jgi:hypothetical protein